jgi:molybdate transport system substrate-binding protein
MISDTTIRRSLIVFLAFLFSFSLVHHVVFAQKQDVRVAAAADLQFAMVDLAKQYEKQTDDKLEVTYGSSGNFYSQLANGAPFDLFFSADVAYPRKLIAANLADSHSFCKYAVGRIVVWAPKGSNLDPTNQKWNALLDPSVQKIALANPDHAPYGRAAVAALKQAGIYGRVKEKVVLGESISQAAQFVQSGNAQVGIVALSLAVSPAMSDGKRWEIPADAYPPIEQGAVVLARSKNKDAARAFLEFVKSESGRASLSQYGFAVPSGATRQP